MAQRDILIFMSDQHGADYTQWGRYPVDTPNLDRMREEGTLFANAYTPCPLCVPARMSFMSSQLPTHTTVFGNADCLSNLTPCFTHALVEQGYETVLVGRMHFTGSDQRHGFTKRIAPDITPVTWNPNPHSREERGRLGACQAEPWCLNVIGAGDSQVIEYDAMVVRTALEYLSRPHDKPQFILVGTYGPHFPYIANKELYLKYMDIVEKPNFFDFADMPDYLKDFDIQSSRSRSEEDAPWEVAKAALAAYLAQIETMDSQIGQVRDAFDKFTASRGTEGVIGYISDHGDTVGERRMFGKQTYYDTSCKVPMVFCGSGFPKKTVTAPVSLMDVGPTLCELLGAEFERADGISLIPYLKDEEDPERIVVSQFVEKFQGRFYASVMLRYKNWKYFVYHHYENKEILFDMDADPMESVNVAEKYPEATEFLREYAKKVADFDWMEETRRIKDRNAKYFKAYEKAMEAGGVDYWSENPPYARGDLEIYGNDQPIVHNPELMRI